MKAFAVPFATISTLTLCGIFTGNYAAASYTTIPLSEPTPIDSVKNTKFSLSNLNPFNPVNDFFNRMSNWWSDLPRKIADVTVNLMANLYELCSTLILKTPLWIFNNEFFKVATHKFSLFALGIVAVLTVIESIKTMLSGWRKGKRPPMKMKDIVKRWSIVALGLSAVPLMFQKAFQGLNFVSEKMISMGGSTMRTVALPEVVNAFDVATLVLFNIALIGTVIPVLWSNGRRFFDIMILGVITPFALTAWIFDSYRHLFDQWWSNLKQLSLVQVYYALYLLVLGWFMFGIPTPDTFTGLIVKLLVVVGGFARMSNPPKIIARQMERGAGFDEVYSDNGKRRDNLKKSKKIVQGVVAGPKGVAKAVWDVSRPKVSLAGATRMSRFHGK